MTANVRLLQNLATYCILRTKLQPYGCMPLQSPASGKDVKPFSSSINTAAGKVPHQLRVLSRPCHVRAGRPLLGVVNGEVAAAAGAGDLAALRECKHSKVGIHGIINRHGRNINEQGMLRIEH